MASTRGPADFAAFVECCGLANKVSLVIELSVAPDGHAKLSAIMRAHAARTLAEEPGCERFDLLQPQGEAGPDFTRLILVEVFTNADALAAHRAMPRMPAHRAEIAPLISHRKVDFCTL